MDYRPLGCTGLQASEIGLGCSSLGWGVSFKDDTESMQVLDRAVELGINFFDTSDIYGFGHCEELIGRAFENRRSKMIIATRVGRLPSPLGRIVRMLLPALQHVLPLDLWKGALKNLSYRRFDYSSSHIRNALEQSLRRFRTDYLDLYQLHSPPTSVLEQGDVFETFDHLKRQGKIRFYGVSVLTISDALLCLQYPNISSLQVPLNLLEQQAVKELLPLAAQKGIAIIARVPLAKGLLTKRMTTQAARPFKARQQETVRAKAQEFSFLAKEGQRSLAQAAIQFVLRHPQVSVVIPGTSTVQHLEENIGALGAPPFTEEELRKTALLS